MQYLFGGMSFTDYSTPMPEAAYTFQTWPVTYFSMAQPDIYGGSEVVVETGNRSYTPNDYEVRLVCSERLGNC